MTHRYLDRVYLREPVPAGSYLAALPAVRALGDREHPLKIPADVTFLVGENGTGKSTLLEALESGKVRAAGLDVWAEEPAKNVALYSHPRVSCTPHIGAATQEAQARIGEEIVSIIQSFFA